MADIEGNTDLKKKFSKRETFFLPYKGISPIKRIIKSLFKLTGDENV